MPFIVAVLLNLLKFSSFAESFTKVYNSSVHTYNRAEKMEKKFNSSSSLLTKSFPFVSEVSGVVSLSPSSSPFTLWFADCTNFGGKNQSKRIYLFSLSFVFCFCPLFLSQWTRLLCLSLLETNYAHIHPNHSRTGATIGEPSCRLD